MKDTKRRLETFSFFDRTGIARHLSEMAAQGWLIEKIATFGWTYRRIAPAKLRFFVSYYPRASEFDPGPTEEQREFHDFCEHTGWHLAVTAAQMQVFYNENENPTPIETDPVLEVETIHAAVKKSYLPSYFLLLVVSILNGALFVWRLLGDFIGLLSSAINLFTGLIWIMLFLVCVMELGGYFTWRARAKKAAKRGDFIDTPSYSRIQKAILVFVLTGFAYWLVTTVWLSPHMMRVAALVMVSYVFGLIAITGCVKELLKRRNVPRGVNRTVTVLFTCILSFCGMGGVTFGVLRASQNGLFDRDRETYEYNGATFTVYMDELPLTVEDLLDVSYDGYIREKRSEESLLLGQFFMRQHPRFDSEHYVEMPFLDYTITEVRLPFLYEFCRDSLLNERKDEIDHGQVVFPEHYESVDASPWRADEAYRLYWGSGYLDKYLLCYEDRIVEINFDWEPTSEQMKIVADKLSGS